MDGFEHLLLTRFNVPHYRYRHDKRATPVRTEAWLAHRWRLFERFCLPSIRGQEAVDFTWLIFFSDETPAPYRERIAAHAAAGYFRPLYVADFEAALTEARRQVQPTTRWLVTTRLDNDDALHRRALATIQTAFRGQALEFLNLLNGCILRGHRVFRATMPENPFCSLIERRTAEGFRTTWFERHDRISAAAPVRNVETAVPCWLQVVHERNLVNNWGDGFWDGCQPGRNLLKRFLMRTRLITPRDRWIHRCRIPRDELRAYFSLPEGAL